MVPGLTLFFIFATMMCALAGITLFFPAIPLSAIWSFKQEAFATFSPSCHGQDTASFCYRS